MDFLKRLSLLLHIAGFLAGVIALPILIAVLFESYFDTNFYDGLEMALIFTFGAPIIGWGLRWLIVGELAEFVPFKRELISALPKDGNFALVFVLAFCVLLTFFSFKETEESRLRWEYKVFESKCNKENGEKAVIGYFKPDEGEVLGDPIYCSDYVEPRYYGAQTLCEWNDGENAGNPGCMRFAANPKPIFLWENLFAPVIFFNLLVFYLLVLIRLIYNKRI